MNTNSSIKTSISAKALAIAGDDIDTDRIIPARFMKCITFDGLGEYAFYDERFDDSGVAKNHPFNDPRYRDAEILLAGHNFGCGSSREHAPQALMRWGISALLAVSFADIFAGNCSAMGIIAATMAQPDAAALSRLVLTDPLTTVTIDLPEMLVTAAGQQWPISMPGPARAGLLAGTWDTMATLLSSRDAILKTASQLPPIAGY